MRILLFYSPSAIIDEPKGSASSFIYKVESVSYTYSSIFNACTTFELSILLQLVCLPCFNGSQPLLSSSMTRTDDIRAIPVTGSFSLMRLRGTFVNKDRGGLMSPNAKPISYRIYMVEPQVSNNLRICVPTHH